MQKISITSTIALANLINAFLFSALGFNSDDDVTEKLALDTVSLKKVFFLR